MTVWNCMRHLEWRSEMLNQHVQRFVFSRRKNVRNSWASNRGFLTHLPLTWLHECQLIHFWMPFFLQKETAPNNPKQPVVSMILGILRCFTLDQGASSQWISLPLTDRGTQVPFVSLPCGWQVFEPWNVPFSVEFAHEEFPSWVTSLSPQYYKKG